PATGTTAGGRRPAPAPAPRPAGSPPGTRLRAACPSAGRSRSPRPAGPSWPAPPARGSWRASARTHRASRVDLDVRFLDELRVLRHLVPDEGRELLRRARHRLDAEVGEALLHVRIGQR